MSGNGFGSKAFGAFDGKPRLDDLADMRVFDQLPRQFRDLLNRAPAKFSAAKVQADLRRYPDTDLVGLYRRQMIEAFPGWRE